MYDVTEGEELIAVEESWCSLYCSAEESMRYCCATQVSAKSSVGECGDKRASDSARKELLELVE